jgi:hypothetical protein
MDIVQVPVPDSCYTVFVNTIFRNDISVEGAATVMINPATAFRMIKVFYIYEFLTVG